MTAGRPKKVDDLTLYALAQHFYGDFKAIEEDTRWRIVSDPEEHKRLAMEAKETSQLSVGALTQLAQSVDREIKLGNMPAGERKGRLRDLRREIVFSRLSAGLSSARKLSQKRVTVREEQDIIGLLLNAREPAQIRQICADAFTTYSEELAPDTVIDVRRSNWLISDASLLPDSLSRHAPEFIDAKRHPKFPGSDRVTTRSKQLWFLARALAGAVHGLKTRTAINRIGSVTPEKVSVISKLSKRTRQPRKEKR